MASRTPRGKDVGAMSDGEKETKDVSSGAQSPDVSRMRRKENAAPKPAQDAELKDYQLGDCLGKGAFGSVYRALNMATGETVAVKQIKLADLPKSELRVITVEIDLLKNLDHPNIVKYHGFVKSSESLNIILEYCENGSLHSISKNFGKFPENLVGLYMSQVLHGLLYLHEQGVIHRDIKGANILTTKQGTVKLADFGVATRTTSLHESSVVGTPYWMAPEVIELSGATTASDIWSLGCTVIELLDGKPPYHKLQPMQALFCIVQDDHPPLPEGASPVVRDFLMQCFQKDHNLRVSARKLLKHPWITNARRSDSVVPTKPTKYEEAVKSVQEWNEALKSPNAGSVRKASRPMSSSPVPARRERPAVLTTPARGPLSLAKPRAIAEQFRSPDNTSDDNWDDDFPEKISPSALQLPHLRPHDHFGGMLSSEKLKTFATIETVAEEINWDDNMEGELTVKSPSRMTDSDPLQTVRPYFASRANTSKVKHSSPIKSPKQKISPTNTRHGTTTPTQPQKPVRAKTQPTRPTQHYRENSVEDYSDLAIDGTFDAKIRQRKNDSLSTRLFHPSDLTNISRPLPGGSLRRLAPTPRKPSMRRTRSSVEIQRYVEDEQDEDFSDILDKVASPIDKQESEKGSECGTLMLNSKLSNNSWLGDEDDDDDPFAELEEGFDQTDLEANVARDKFARLCTQVESLVGSLKTSVADDMLADISEQLLEVLSDSPDTKSVIISAHGMLPILEILESCSRRDIIFNLLRTVNLIAYDDVEIQENLCFVGGIPIINRFASKKYSSEIRLQAAAFVRQMCQTSTLTLQMFVSAGGLKVLVDFLEEDYEEERDLVLIGVNGVWSVFELQGPTPKNDFCRILSRNSVLDPLSLVLSRVLDEEGELAETCEGRIAKIFFLFSQAENHVKETVADRTVLHRVLKELKRMSPNHQITMLKFIKNLSMLSTTLDTLHISNAIDVLTELLRSSSKARHFKEVSNQILNTLYNLCRLNKSRQEEAALNGVIKILMQIYKTDRPLKEFALPILCDMAHSGKVGRRELWRCKGLQFYISLLSEPSWQVTALDAILIWLQEETARVEEALLTLPFTPAITHSFTTSKANAFENLLDPLQKLLRLSPPLAASLAGPPFFARILAKLTSQKALVRLSLLRIVQSIADAAADDQPSLITAHNLYNPIHRLAEADPAILVRDMASKLIAACDASDALFPKSTSRAATRRASSSSTPPGGYVAGGSMPPTPTSSRSGHSTTYFDNRDVRARGVVVGQVPFRAMREESSASSGGGSVIGSRESGVGVLGSAAVNKSKLPRIGSRASRSSLLVSPTKREEGSGARVSTPTGGRTPVLVPNSRRRRLGGERERDR